ncbi:MAG: hypothetical protein Phog2KO_09320 [Phototrophicaceae bacterium]
MLVACIFSIVLVIIAPPTKSCQLKSLTLAECKDSYERFGNGVPESPTCFWEQNYIAGLILVGEEYNKQCYSG